MTKEFSILVALFENTTRKTVSGVQKGLVFDVASFIYQQKDLTNQLDRFNQILKFRSYVIASAFSLADLVLFFRLRESKADLNKFGYLERWYNYIGSYPEIAEFDSDTEKATKLMAGKKNAAQQKKKKGPRPGWSLPDTPLKKWKGKVITRFPPEPSGYLHIGHAKACFINFNVAKYYEGSMLCRFDDTNPAKENPEFVRNILNDVKSLGVSWSRLTHTSDYFDMIMEFGTQCLVDGTAYIDDTPPKKMSELRCEGIPSPCRENSVEKNLNLWKEMIAGSKRGQQCVMRAKFDPKDVNLTLRDPSFFRVILGQPHPRHGFKYKVYPTYDFACPIVDSYEQISHVMRTTEYNDRKAQFYKVWDITIGRKDGKHTSQFLKKVACTRPEIVEYSRLNFCFATLSKRRLKWFVQNNLVSGWNDPRFPTIQGMTRRGLVMKALEDFCAVSKVSRAVNLTGWDKLYAMNRKIIDDIAKRFSGISSDCVRVNITGTNDGSDLLSPKTLDLPFHPSKNLGKRQVAKSNVVLVERADAKSFKLGGIVTFLGWGNFEITKFVVDGNDFIIDALFQPKNVNYKNTYKATWVSAAHTVPVKFIELDHLLRVPKPEVPAEEVDPVTGDVIEAPDKIDNEMKECVREKTWFETDALIEDGFVKHCKKGDFIQVQRRGNFIIDKMPAKNEPGHIILIPSGKQKQMSVLNFKVDLEYGVENDQ